MQTTEYDEEEPHQRKTEIKKSDLQKALEAGGWRFLKNHSSFGYEGMDINSINEIIREGYTSLGRILVTEAHYENGRVMDQHTARAVYVHNESDINPFFGM